MFMALSSSPSVSGAYRTWRSLNQVATASHIRTMLSPRFPKSIRGNGAWSGTILYSRHGTFERHIFESLFRGLSALLKKGGPQY
jgi:hypothetical protein